MKMQDFKNQKHDADDGMEKARQSLEHFLTFLCRRLRIFYGLTNHKELVAVIDKVSEMQSDQCVFYSMEMLLVEYERPDSAKDYTKSREVLVSLMSQYIEKAKTLIENQ